MKELLLLTLLLFAVFGVVCVGYLVITKFKELILWAFNKRTFELNSEYRQRAQDLSQKHDNMIEELRREKISVEANIAGEYREKFDEFFESYVDQRHDDQVESLQIEISNLTERLQYQDVEIKGVLDNLEETKRRHFSYVAESMTVVDPQIAKLASCMSECNTLEDKS